MFVDGDGGSGEMVWSSIASADSAIFTSPNCFEIGVMCLLQFGIGSCGTGNQEHETTGNVNSTRYYNYLQMVTGVIDRREQRWLEAWFQLRLCMFPGWTLQQPLLTLTRIRQGWWEDGWTDTMPVFCIHTHIPSVWWMIMFGLRVSGITVVSINCRSGPGVALRAENQKILSHKDWFPPKKSAQSFHGEY